MIWCTPILGDHHLNVFSAVFFVILKSEDILQLSMIHCDFEGADASLQAYSVMGIGSIYANTNVTV